MRLRQIALITDALEDGVRQADAGLGLSVAYRDPEVAEFGIINAVLPLDDGFVELLQPVDAGASASRFLARGGPRGYMLIVQVADPVAERERLATLGVRMVWKIERSAYTCYHFHPADTGGVLLSFDMTGSGDDPYALHGPWPPAGNDWAGHLPGNGLALGGVVIASNDPAGHGELWSRLLGRPLVRQGDAFVVRFDHGQDLRVVQARDGRTGFIGLILTVPDGSDLRPRIDAMGGALCGTSLLIEPRAGAVAR